jgi:very-short-patch-repair endonuclease
LKENPPRDEDPAAPLFRDRARKLRREATEAERKLWSRLRYHSMGVKFRRQHPVGNFIVDFISLEAKLANCGSSR